MPTMSLSRDNNSTSLLEPEEKPEQMHERLTNDLPPELAEMAKQLMDASATLGEDYPAGPLPRLRDLAARRTPISVQQVWRWTLGLGVVVALAVSLPLLGGMAGAPAPGSDQKAAQTEPAPAAEPAARLAHDFRAEGAAPSGDSVTAPDGDLPLDELSGSELEAVIDLIEQDQQHDGKLSL